MLLAGVQSDDFNALTLDPAWTFTDPVGDASLVLDGTAAVISLPAGVNHNLNAGGNNKTARLTQTVDDTDFEIEAKFDNVSAGRFAQQGIFIEQSGGDSLLFELRSDPRRSIRVQVVSNGGVTVFGHQLIEVEGPFTMRVGRNGDTWTQSYSSDGQNFTTANTISHSLAVDTAGVFVGNSGSEAAPAFVSSIDYVFDTANPIVPEDVDPSLDTTAPLNSHIRFDAPSTTISVDWTTNESATGSVDYGLTDQYELGTATEAAAGENHSVQIPSLNPFTTYYVRINSAGTFSGLTSQESNYLIHTGGDVDPESKPVIDVWYGPGQQFGQQGNPQLWVNLLGNVYDPDGVTSLTYELNGSGPVGLNFSANNQRLAGDGDFNIDLPLSQLVQGANSVDVVATDSPGNQSTQTLAFNWDGTQTWPADYVIDWSTAAAINDVAQVVDGNWMLTPAGVRTIEPGFERLINFGDIAAADYEVTVPVTVHHWDESGTTIPAVGLIANWEGHHASDPNQPHTTKWPIGALGWAKYGGLGLIGNDAGRLTNPSTLGRIIELEEPYVHKLRVESNPGQSSTYSYKVWKQSDPEPANWDLVGDGPEDELSAGSIVLLATHADATFGNVTVCPAGSCSIGGVGDSDPADDAVLENSPAGTTVGITALAVDPDPTDTVTYSLDADAGGLFAIDAQSGEVSTTQELDFETAASHAITVRATSSDGSFSTADFTVNVANVSDTPPQKFFVVDFGQRMTFDYDFDFNHVGNHDLDNANNRPRGLATDATFLNYWVLNNDDTVFYYDADFNLQGSWLAMGLHDSQAIASDGTDVWITDVETDRVYFYEGVAGLTSGSRFPTSSFALHQSNNHPYGITTDGTHLWVMNAGAGQHVFKYETDGTFLGQWAILDNLNGRGIAVDPSAPEDIWVLNAQGDEVLRFVNAAGVTSGSLFADEKFNLPGANDSASGIAAFKSNSGGVLPISDTNPAGDEVFENQPPGAATGVTAFAQDPDAGDTVTYSLDDDAEGRFAIDASTGIVTTALPLDRTIAASHTITVRATSSDSSFTTADFTIDVLSDAGLHGFFVADQTTATTYIYDSNVVATGTFGLPSGPRGMATTGDGATVWSIDGAGNVSMFDTDGNSLGSWLATDVVNPEGIATDGQDVWILDRGADRVRYYVGEATRDHGDSTMTSSFPLAAGNDEAWGITTDGDSLWVINTLPAVEVFKYDTDGTLIGSWTPEGANGSARGITIDPNSVDDVWIVLRGADQVLQYNGAADVVSGSVPVDTIFDLDDANTTPQGIARFGVPPAPGPDVTVDMLITTDDTPQLTGTVSDPAATIEVEVAGNSYAAVNNADGTWTLPDDVIDPPLASGIYDVDVTATNAAGSDGRDTTMGELIVDLASPSDDLVVVDQSADSTFEYDTTGNLTSSWNLGASNNAPRGVTVDATGRKWVIDNDDHVYVYSPSGFLIGLWDAAGLGTPNGIATDGQDLWIVDSGMDKVFRYAGAAARIDGVAGPDGEFSLTNGNSNPKGITTDGSSFWIVNDATQDKVFKYTIDGTPLGVWTIDKSNKRPRGIAVDPVNPGSVWIVDARDELVFEYAAAAPLTSGSRTADFQFPLDAANTVSEGIARLPGSPSTAPTVAISRQDANPLTGDTATFNLLFSEDVSNVDASDFDAAGTGTVTGTVAGVTDGGDSDPLTYSVTVDSITGTGTLGLSVNPATDIQNAAAETLNPVPTLAEEYTVVSSDIKFFVVDQSADDTFRYDSNVDPIDSYELGPGNNAPRGAASDPAGTRLWVIDNDDFVYVYDVVGELIGSWKATGLGTPTGIASDGVHIWIVDSTRDRAFYFENGAALTEGTHTATSELPLDSTNRNPRGITTDGTDLWVVNDATSIDRVFKYNIGTGSLLGSWIIDSANSRPRGITIDPNNVDHIWIVDSASDQVFRYDGAASRIADSQNADAVIDLAPGNSSPEGIADPLIGHSSAARSNSLLPQLDEVLSDSRDLFDRI